jgi:serine/threonine-protein kinase
VLLYELLTGHLPYVEAERGAIGWSKAIVEETPQSLSRALSRTEVAASPGAATLAAHRIAAARGTSPARLRSALRGDLERIVQRALQKSPEARYASVAALADDLNAFVQARPISGGSRRYRLRKFISRHWLPLGAGTAAILALVIGAVAFAREARQREQEAERALREQQTTKAVKDFLFGLFGGIDPYEAKRKDVSARELLDRGAQRIDKELAGEPATKAEVQAVLGRIYYQLGLYPQASELQQRAIEALKGDAGHALLLARTETDRVDTLRSIGDFAAAAPLAADAAARLDAAADVVAVDRVRALNALTKLAVAKRDFAAAKEHSDASLALARSAKVLDALLADTLLTAGTSAWGLGLLDEAEARQREALAITTRLNGPDDPLAAIAHTNLAMTLRARSRFAEALEEIQAALATRSKVLGADHPSVVTNRVDLGLTQYHLGHYREAREVLQQAIDTMKAQAADNPNIPGAQINLGLALAESGDLDGAEGAFEAAQEAWQKKYGAEYPGVLVAKGNLGYVHQLRGELERAETELKEVKALGEKRGVKDDVSTLYRLGEVRRLRGDAAEAIALDRQALELARKGGGENNRFAALAHYCLGLALRDSGDRAAAEQEFRAALASFAGYLPGGAHPYAATARLELAQLRQSQAETRAEDVKLVNEAVELRERFLGPEDPRTRAARLQLQQLQARR